uniref:Uncharacterized protein n=1 Tax=Chaetoceros debilis TaxID=122233 RepID=A0A7S3VG18_9STRA
MTHIALIRRLSAGNRKVKYGFISPFCNPLNISPDSKRERDDNYLNNSRNNDRLQPSRTFHATPKKEILPLIAIGAGVVGMYSFRALKRMDHEWEEYQEELAEYNLEHGASGTGSPSSQGNSLENNIFSGGKMAIDLGTLNIRVAHRSSSSDNEKPNVIVNREGSRSTPNHILFDTDGSFVTGTLASGKFYERSNSNTPVVNVGQLARSTSRDNDGAVKDLMIEEVLSACAKNALDQAVGNIRVSSSSSSSCGRWNRAHRHRHRQRSTPSLEMVTLPIVLLVIRSFHNKNFPNVPLTCMVAFQPEGPSSVIVGSVRGHTIMVWGWGWG